VAEKATIYKLNLTLSDMDRQVYGDYNLTLALHPSETVERMMVRILAFCYRAAETLSFTKGLSSVDEPDLWLKHDNGTILEWIEVGQPAPDRVKKAANQSQAVHLFTYGRGWDVWWKTNGDTIKAMPKVTSYFFAAEELKSLCELADKSMKLTVTITEKMAYVSNEAANVVVSLVDL
jgi:uncharacterized protein YaeQ